MNAAHDAAATAAMPKTDSTSRRCTRTRMIAPGCVMSTMVTAAAARSRSPAKSRSGKRAPNGRPAKSAAIAAHPVATQNPPATSLGKWDPVTISAVPTAIAYAAPAAAAAMRMAGGTTRISASAIASAIVAWPLGKLPTSGVGTLGRGDNPRFRSSVVTGAATRTSTHASARSRRLRTMASATNPAPMNASDPIEIVFSSSFVARWARGASSWVRPSSMAEKSNRSPRPQWAPRSRRPIRPLTAARASSKSEVCFLAKAMAIVKIGAPLPLKRYPAAKDVPPIGRLFGRTAQAAVPALAALDLIDGERAL